MNIWTWPNVLTVIRFFIACWFAVLVGYSRYGYEVELWALGGFVIGSVTDWADGRIARKWPRQQSWIGSVLDPLADKLLVACYAFYLWSAGIADGWFEVACFGLILLREVTVTFFRAWWGPDAVPVDQYGKWKAAFQMGTLVLYGLFPLLPDLRETLAPVALLGATILTYWSLVRYLAFPEGTVKA